MIPAKYFKDFKEQKPSLNPPFSSVYVCSNILPKQIVFEEVNKEVKADGTTTDGIPSKTKVLGILPNEL